MLPLSSFCVCQRKRLAYFPIPPLCFSDQVQRKNKVPTPTAVLLTYPLKSTKTTISSVSFRMSSEVTNETNTSPRNFLKSIQDTKVKPELDEKDSGEVTLHNINPEEFAIFIDYAYTGRVDITTDNVQDILIRSDYLNVRFVKELCIKFMADNFDNDNICDILLFSLQYPVTELAEKAKEFWIHHLEEISQTEKFFQMDAAFLEKIFADDDLILYDGRYRNKALSSTKREKLIFISVLRYLSKSFVSSPEIIELMIRTVRLPQISEDMVKKCLDKFKTLEDNEVVKKYVRLREVAVEYLQERGNNSAVMNSARFEIQEIPGSWFKKRIYGVVSLCEGGFRYAAQGQIQDTPHPPKFEHTDRNIQIRRIEIWLRIWENKVLIGGLTLTYRSSSKHVDASVVYMRGDCPEGRADHVVELEPDEFIVEVVVGNGFLIDRLGFTTNKGRMLGPFGGPGGSEDVESSPPGELSYLYDINCDTVNTEGAGAIFNLMLRWISFS